ncbi:hypothetical protein [Aeromonas sp.]|uniref:hypothetical protein n=1 Tax=Aeromonas sp. TaxID=647 RepID=UPI00257FAAA6|nr:hypothetical protein [Aeromonas sp.]
MKKYTLSLLTLSVALSSGAAFANIIGPASDKSVDVTFSEGSIIGHTLTQVSGLEPGNIPNKIIAQGKVTTDSESGNIKVAFTGAGATTGGDYSIHRFDGLVATNKIWVSLQPVNGNFVKRPSGMDGGIVIKPDTDGGTDFSYTINVGSVNSNVVADTYRINVKAHRWVE